MNSRHLRRRRPVAFPTRDPLVEFHDDFHARLEKRFISRAVRASTSEDVAHLAARGLFDPASLTLAEIRSVCASALSQRRD